MSALVPLFLTFLASSCAVARPTIIAEDSDAGKIPEFLRSLLAQPETIQMDCKTQPCIPRLTYVGMIRPAGVSKSIMWLEAAQEAGAKAVVIELNSPGGDVDAGFLLIRAIEDLKIPTYCIAEHETASEAFAILQSCTHRLMTKRTQLLTHDISFTVAIRDNKDEPILKPIKPIALEVIQRNLADNLRTASLAHAEQCQHRLKVSMKVYLGHLAEGREWYMNWKEALAVGAVDSIVESVGAVERALRKKESSRAGAR